MRRSNPYQPPTALAAALATLQAEIVACRRCPRLVAHREGVAREKRRAFSDTANMLRRRIELLANLPLDKLDRLSLQNKVRDIGKARS